MSFLYKLERVKHKSNRRNKLKNITYNRNKNKLQKSNNKNLRDRNIKAIYKKIYQFRSEDFEDSIF